MLVYLNSQAVSLREAFPNVSFSDPASITEFLGQKNIRPVRQSRDFDQRIEKLIECEPYEEHGIIYTVKIQTNTSEELANQFRVERDAKLKESDWTQIADAPVDKVAWAAYRQALRDLPTNSEWPRVDLPTAP